MSPAFKGAFEGAAGIAGGVVADRDPAVTAQVDVRREGDGAALEGEAFADLLCKSREVGSIGDDPVAGRGGVERGVVVSVVRPEGLDLRLRGGENFAAPTAAFTLRKQLGFEDDEDLMSDLVVDFKGIFVFRVLAGRAAGGAGVIIDRAVGTVGFGLQIFPILDSGAVVVSAKVAVFGVAVVADSLLLAGRTAAVAVLRLGVGGVVLAGAGVGTVAVGDPCAPVVAEGVAGGEGRLVFRALGGCAAAGAGLVVDRCVVAVGFGLQVHFVRDLGGVAMFTEVAVFAVAVVAEGLVRAVRRAAVAVSRLGVGGIDLAGTGVCVVAVGDPRVPVVVAEVAVGEGRFVFRALGAFAADGAGLVIDRAAFASGFGF